MLTEKQFYKIADAVPSLEEFCLQIGQPVPALAGRCHAAAASLLKFPGLEASVSSIVKSKKLENQLRLTRGRYKGITPHSWLQVCDVVIDPTFWHMDKVIPLIRVCRVNAKYDELDSSLRAHLWVEDANAKVLGVCPTKPHSRAASSLEWTAESTSADLRRLLHSNPFKFTLSQRRFIRWLMRETASDTIMPIDIKRIYDMAPNE